MKTTYDASVIYEAADRLYQQANSVIVLCSLIGTILGAAAGYLVLHETFMPAIGAAMFGLIGFAIGRGRAFALRLQAQVALCQVKIEENTRRPTSA